MSYSDFLELTPRQFYNAANGFIEHEERLRKETWEQTRLILTFIQNKPVYMYKIKQMKPDQIMKFPWEKGSLPDEEELKQLRQLLWPQGQ